MTVAQPCRRSLSILDEINRDAMNTSVIVSSVQLRHGIRIKGDMVSAADQAKTGQNVAVLSGPARPGPARPSILTAASLVAKEARTVVSVPSRPDVLQRNPK